MSSFVWAEQETVSAVATAADNSAAVAELAAASADSESDTPDEEESLVFEEDDYLDKDAPSFFLSVMPYVSYTLGKQSEYVFIGKLGEVTKDVTLSQIDYEEKPLFKFGIKVKNQLPYVYAVLDVVAGIPSYCGYVYDYDWNIRSNDITDDTITNFSQSDSVLDKYYEAGLDLGAKIPVGKFVISPYGGVQYRYSKFYAEGGEYYYNCFTDGAGNIISAGWYNAPEASTGSFTGNVLSLERKVLFTWVGIDVNYKLNDRLSFEADLAISPYTYINSLDCHYLKSTKYLDLMDGFFSVYKAGLGVYFETSSSNSIVFNWNLLASMVLKGKLYYTNINTNEIWYKLSDYYAGADFLYNALSFGYQIKL